MDRKLTDDLVDHWMQLACKECGHEDLTFETGIYMTNTESGIVSLRYLGSEIVLAIYVIYDDFFIAVDNNNYCAVLTIRPGYNMIQTIMQASKYYKPQIREKHKRSITSCYAYFGSGLFEQAVMNWSDQFQQDHHRRAYKFVEKYSTKSMFHKNMYIYIYSVGRQIYLFAAPFSKRFERVDTSDPIELAEFRARGLDYIISREQPMFLKNVVCRDMFSDLIVRHTE